MTVFGVILLVPALALLVFGLLSWARKLPGNAIVGLRVPEVRKSRQAWDDAHAAAGPVWTFGGVVLLIGAMIAFVATSWLWIVPVLTVLLALVALSLGANAGARIASLADVPEDGEGGGCGDSCGCGSGGEADPTPVQIDIEALRRAATEADKD